MNSCVFITHVLLWWRRPVLRWAWRCRPSCARSVAPCKSPRKTGVPTSGSELRTADEWTPSEGRRRERTARCNLGARRELSARGGEGGGGVAGVLQLTADGGGGRGPGQVQARGAGAGQAQRGPRRRRQRAHLPLSALLAPGVAHGARVVVDQRALQACNGLGSMSGARRPAASRLRVSLSITRASPSSTYRGSRGMAEAGRRRLHVLSGGGTPTASQTSLTRSPSAAWTRRPNEVIFAGAANETENPNFLRFSRLGIYKNCTPKWFYILRM